MGEIRNEYKTFIGKPEMKEPLGRPRRRWEDNNRMYLRKIMVEGCGLDSFGSMVFCEHGNETSGSIKGREFLD
jgi:hypothetical protein